MTNKISAAAIAVRPLTEADSEFSYKVYASTRSEEMSVTGWSETEIDAFLRMQFSLQHTHYRQNYAQAAFDLILIDGLPAGRLYVDRQKEQIIVIDIALLPEFRGRGAGGRIMRELAEEADRRGVSMSLHVERHNPILAFYQRLGFREKGVYGVYYQMERPSDRVPGRRVHD